jgi:hypothetical protein
LTFGSARDTAGRRLFPAVITGISPALAVSLRQTAKYLRGGTDMNAAQPEQAAREMNVLIVALDVVPTEAPKGKVLVVAPALNSRLRRWLSDEDGARRQAMERVVAHVEELERRGIHAEGRVGDADPLLAIADALRTFPADRIMIAAGPHSSQLADGLAARTQKRFALPTSHNAEPLPAAA